MKHIIIFEDDIHLANLIKLKINAIELIKCEYIFSNPINFF